MARVLEAWERGGDNAVNGLSHRHHLLLSWLVRNPHRTDAEAAAVLGYSPNWVSRVVRSDAFQVELHKLLGEARQRALNGLEEKAARLLHKSLDKTELRLSAGPVSDKFLQDTNATLLKALGYGVPKPVAVGNGPQHLHLHVTAKDIEDARARRSERAGTTVAKLAPLATTEVGTQRPVGEGDGEAARDRTPLTLVA